MNITFANNIYNFKIGGYTSWVVQIGDQQQTEYEFEVTGFFKPTVTHDGIYYGNLDIPLIEKLSDEAAVEISCYWLNMYLKSQIYMYELKC